MSDELPESSVIEQVIPFGQRLELDAAEFQRWQIRRIVVEPSREGTRLRLEFEQDFLRASGGAYLGALVEALWRGQKG